MADRGMQQRILWQIYTSYPFSLNDIETACSCLKSYDALIAACEAARKEGYSSLLDYTPKKTKPDAKLETILSGDFDTIRSAGRQLREILKRDGAESAVSVGAEDYTVRAVIEALFKEKTQ